MGVEGLKIGLSGSTGDDGDGNGSSSTVETAYSVGLSYVTTAGDSTVTIGGGIASSETRYSGSSPTNDRNGFNIGISAVTGDLTVGVGYGDGDTFDDQGNATTNTANTSSVQVDGSVMKAGVKYVSGDITMAIGATAGEAKDSSTMGTAGTTDDAYDSVGASLTYAVASGVSAVLGYTTVDVQDEGASDNSGGSAWYVGATMSF